MLNLNDDMDDLIRQAAEEYPLKTEEGKDWDKVVAGLQSVALTTPARNKKYWWLLLLLIPLILAVPVFYNSDNKTTKSSVPSNASATDAPTKKQEADELAKKDNTTAAQQATDNSNKAASATTKPDIAADKSELQHSNHFTPNTTSGRNNNNAIAANDVSLKTNKNNPENNNQTDINNTVPVTNPTVADTYKKDNGTLESNNKATATGDMNKPDNAAKEAENTGIETERIALTTDSTNVNKSAIAAQKDSEATVKKANIKHTTPVKTKGFYAGAAFALDATTVKMNKVDKIGHTSAVVLGYRINNHWSIESGLMWDNKKYYSPGAYFDKSKTDFSADYNIHYLNGYCKMFEIPIDVKYDFKSRKLSGFYIAAGLSTYIMRHEYYNYFVTHYSTPTDPGYFREKDYKNATTNLFSVANISGGYQFIFKNNNSLRIEPYFKVPLSGLGIGNLPFSSTGISAAYTLPLHH